MGHTGAALRHLRARCAVAARQRRRSSQWHGKPRAHRVHCIWYTILSSPNAPLPIESALALCRKSVGDVPTRSGKTMRLLIALALLCAAFPAAASAEQTSRFEFVKEYVRQLGAIDKARDLAALDESAPSPPRISGPVRGRARIVAALSNQIQILRGMRLPEPFERLADNIADFYQHKVDLYHSMKDDVVKASTPAA